MTHLITGATSGLGLEMARRLVVDGGEVWVHGRTPQSAQRARAETGAARAFSADLADLNAIRSMAEAIIEAGGVDVLTNNAGAFFKDEGHTDSGLERHLAINHLAPFVLTRALLPHIRGRIVVVASGAHTQAKPDWDDLQWTSRSYSSMRAYADSKLFNILFTRSLAKRTELSVNCLHPGFVDTGIGSRGESRLVQQFGRLVKMFGKSAARAVDCQLWAATSSEAGAMTGQYFVKSKVKATSAMAEDEALGARLWTLSEQWASNGS